MTSINQQELSRCVSSNSTIPKDRRRKLGILGGGCSDGVKLFKATSSRPEDEELQKNYNLIMAALLGRHHHLEALIKSDVGKRKHNNSSETCRG